MNLKERISAIAELGTLLRGALEGRENKFTAGLIELAVRQHFINPWFTPEHVRYALNSIAQELTEENLVKWTNGYPWLQQEVSPVRVGIIMAGNIPLVGFHDFISVLISGNKVVAKTSSKDSELIVKIASILCSIDSRFNGMIEFAEGKLQGFDAIIATGSNNSSRYFEYYFGKYPNIIRKNRNSVAIIDGTETDAELEALGSDIFLYFGLGCRNVSKIYIPAGYEITNTFRSWQKFSDLTFHSRYANNYDYNKAIYLVNRDIFLDTGYLLVKEDSSLSSPVAVLHYEKYDSYEMINKMLTGMTDSIQCIAGHGYLPFGEAQNPHLWDYADGNDTIQFLSKKN